MHSKVFLVIPCTKLGSKLARVGGDDCTRFFFFTVQYVPSATLILQESNLFKRVQLWHLAPMLIRLLPYCTCHLITVTDIIGAQTSWTHVHMRWFRRFLRATTYPIGSSTLSLCLSSIFKHYHKYTLECAYRIAARDILCAEWSIERRSPIIDK